jgi:kynureninase
MSAVSYLSSLMFDLKAISKACHDNGIYLLVDLAHAIGAVPIKLDEWEIDAAAWCTSKYLSGGAGSIGGLYVNEKHLHMEPAF